MNGNGSSAARDLATKRYVRSVDNLMVELNELAGMGVLDQIAEYLVDLYGAPPAPEHC